MLGKIFEWIVRLYFVIWYLWCGSLLLGLVTGVSAYFYMFVGLSVIQLPLMMHRIENRKSMQRATLALDKYVAELSEMWKAKGSTTLTVKINLHGLRRLYNENEHERETI